MPTEHKAGQFPCLMFCSLQSAAKQPTHTKQTHLPTRTESEKVNMSPGVTVNGQQPEKPAVRFNPFMLESVFSHTFLSENLAVMSINF